MQKRSVQHYNLRTMRNLPPQLAEMLHEIVQQYAPHHTLYAFGSRVRGTAHAGSDLDLVLRQDASPELVCEGLSALQTALSESNIPMLIDIHDWARLPEHMRAEIAKGMVAV